MAIVVVRADDDLSQMLRDAGFEVINLELVRTHALEELGEFDNLVSRLDEYDGVFFTSPVAAAVFISRVEPRLRPTVYSLGRRSATALVDAGFVVKTIPDANTADEMLAAFGDDEFAGKKLLFVSGERSMRAIPEKLRQIAEVDEVSVYRTVEVEPASHVIDDIRHRLLTGEIEWTCFFSPSAVEAFQKRFGAAGFKAAAIGRTTAEWASELGLNVGLIASRASSETFGAELIERITNEHSD